MAIRLLGKTSGIDKLDIIQGVTATVSTVGTEPRVERRQALFVVALGVAIFLYLLADIKRPFNLYDEGFAAYASMRVLRGEVPYRDFYASGYSPGQFYVIAGLFQLFGTNILVMRIYDVIVRFALSVVSYLIARKLSTPRAAALTWIVTAVALLPPNFYYGYAVFPALLFVFLAVLSFLEYIQSKRKIWLAGAGLLVGAAMAFRHDIGLYSFIAIAVALVAMALRNMRGPSNSATSLLERVKLSAGFLLLFTVASAAVVGPIMLALLSRVSPQHLWEDLVVIPYQVFPKQQGLPTPPIFPASVSALGSWIAFYFPLLTFIVGVAAVTVAFRRNQRSAGAYRSVEVWCKIVLILLGCLLFIRALNRNDQVHLVPSYVAAIILLVVTANSLFSQTRRTTSHAVQKLSYSLALLLPIFYIGLAIATELEIMSMTWGLGCKSPTEQAGCLYISEDNRQALDYVRGHTLSNERIFVGLSRHDRIYVNDSMFYFLSDRPSATKYQSLVPGIATTMPVQQEIVGDLIKNHVRYVVLYSGFENIVEPNESGKSSGVLLLDEFIRRHYRPAHTFGDYSIWQSLDATGSTAN